MKKLTFFINSKVLLEIKTRKSFYFYFSLFDTLRLTYCCCEKLIDINLILKILIPRKIWHNGKNPRVSVIMPSVKVRL